MVDVTADDLYSPSSEFGPYRAADFQKLPDESRFELIHGRFFVCPSPNKLHQTVVYLIFEFVRRMSIQTGGLPIGGPMDVTLFEHSIVQPDVLYITPERLAIAKERVEGAPDLVIEVASPNTSRRDRVEKLRLYAEAGVAEYWLVDPVARQIDFLVNRGGVFVVALSRDNVYCSERLPGIRLDLVEFWREVDATYR